MACKTCQLMELACEHIEKDILRRVAGRRRDRLVAKGLEEALYRIRGVLRAFPESIVQPAQDESEDLDADWDAPDLRAGYLCEEEEA